MKNALLAGLALVALAGTVNAAAITPGNVVVYRVSGTTSVAAAVFVDEYNPAGALVQSIALPTAGTDAFTASGSATSEGGLTVSPDGRWITITGYNAAVGTTGVAATSSAAAPRTVAILDATTGNVASYTRLTDSSYSGNNIRSAVTTNGTDIWTAGTAGGTNGGVRYTTAGASSATFLSSTVTNVRQVNVFGSQLYVSDASGSTSRLGTVGSGLPTTGGQTITSLPSFPAATGSPYQFFLADLSSSVAGVDTLYVADDTAGIVKYSLVGGSWVSNGTIGAGSDAYRGLTASVNGNTVTLFATGNGLNLVSLTDTTGYNGAFSGSVSPVATASTGTAIRGIGYIPVAVPTPGSIALLGLGGLVAARRRR